MRILIIEDEPLAAKRLQKMIKTLEPSAQVECCLDSIESSIEWLENHPIPDLIFMDIHLADGESLELFSLVKIDCPVIFVTAYDEYALRAFRVNALDYLLKPIKKKELAIALEKFKKSQPANPNYAQIIPPIQRNPYAKRFLIRLGQQLKVVEIKQVAYFYTQDKITFLVTFKGRRYPIDYSMEAIEQLASPRDFFRVNRQFIIHLEAIEEMLAYSKSRVKLHLQPTTEQEVIVSTERSPLFKKWLVGENE